MRISISRIPFSIRQFKAPLYGGSYPEVGFAKPPPTSPLAQPHVYIAKVSPAGPGYRAGLDFLRASGETNHNQHNFQPVPGEGIWRHSKSGGPFLTARIGFIYSGRTRNS